VSVDMNWHSYNSQKAIPTNYRGAEFAAHFARNKNTLIVQNRWNLRKQWVGGKRIFQFSVAQKTACKAPTLVLLEVLKTKIHNNNLILEKTVFHHCCLIESELFLKLRIQEAPRGVQLEVSVSCP